MVQQMMTLESTSRLIDFVSLRCLYRDGTGGCVRGAEGPRAARPGGTSNSPWSEGSKNYIRNVEAVGSNPITST